MRQRAQIGQRRVAHGLIGGNQTNRVGTGAAAAIMECGDIDLCITKHPTKLTDEARAVLVTDIEQMRPEFGLDRYAGNLDDPWPLIAKE